MTPSGIVLERTLEIVLSRHPDLLGSDWALVGQQLAMGAGVLDLLFKDQEGRLHLVEVKKGPATLGAISQVLRYVEEYRRQGCESTPWIVAHSLPTDVAQHAMRLGVSTKAFSMTELEEYLVAKGESVANIMSLRRRADEALSGGSGDLWRSVDPEQAYAETANDVVDVLRDLAGTEHHLLKPGAMQTTIWYKGVKLGGFNRKHRGGVGYVTSGVISPPLRTKLESLGFRWMEKKQSGKSHVHTWMEIPGGSPANFRQGIGLVRAAVESKLGTSA